MKDEIKQVLIIIICILIAIATLISTIYSIGYIYDLCFDLNLSTTDILIYGSLIYMTLVFIILSIFRIKSIVFIF